MTQGICRNATCPSAANASLVERYPGPGEYCPDCGEPLAEVEPFGDLSPLQALERLETARLRPLPARRRWRVKLYLLTSVAFALVAMGALVAYHSALTGRTNGDALHVCRSSLSQRLASHVVAAYRTASGVSTRRVDFTPEGACDVRFAVVWGSDANSSAVVGRDAIVVVVNPQNPLTRLTTQQLHQVLTGEIGDWSQLGSGSGTISAIVPDDGTDEAAVLAKQILNGAPLARNVRRAASTADVVAAVSGTRGRTLIGVAAFSGAVPAKVVALGSGATPSVISIAGQRYPLAVAITVEATGAAPPAEATNLIRYVHSDVVQTIVSQDGLIPLRGY